ERGAGRWAAVARQSRVRAGFGHLWPYLEMAALLDPYLPRRGHGRFARTVRGRGSRLRQPAAEIQVRDPAADGRDVPGLHHALHDLGAGRFQRRALHLRRRAGAVDACAGDARHPQRLRTGRSPSRHGDGADGAAPADPAGDPADAPAAAQRGHDMTAQRRGRVIDSIGVWLLSAVLLVWRLLPIYNIIRV